MSKQRIKIYVIDDIFEEYRFEITNGINTTAIEVFSEVEWFKELGNALCAFPNSIEDSVEFDFGGANRSLALKVYCYEWRGQTALQIEVQNNLPAPDSYVSRFSIKTVPASINNLGQMLLDWDPYSYGRVEWIAED